MSEKSNHWEMTQSDLGIAAIKSAYRRVSVMLGFVGAGLALIARLVRGSSKRRDAEKILLP